MPSWEIHVWQAGPGLHFGAVRLDDLVGGKCLVLAEGDGVCLCSMVNLQSYDFCCFVISCNVVEKAVWPFGSLIGEQCSFPWQGRGDAVGVKGCRDVLDAVLALPEGC